MKLDLKWCVGQLTLQVSDMFCVFQTHFFRKSAAGVRFSKSPFFAIPNDITIDMNIAVALLVNNHKITERVVSYFGDYASMMVDSEDVVFINRWCGIHVKNQMNELRGLINPINFRPTM